MRIEDAPKDSIRTFSGLFINVFEPTPEMICIKDVAHSLSQQPRFAGHLFKFYSVAQHSVLCMRYADDKNKLGALLHDSSEGYLLDIPSPIKRRMPEYKSIEDNLMSAIAKKYGFEYPLTPEVHAIDRKLLHIEWEALMINKDENFECWSQQEAEYQFLTSYKECAKFNPIETEAIECQE
jgi:hypothetical protein